LRDFILPEGALSNSLIVESASNDCSYEFSTQGSLFVSCQSPVELLDVGYEVQTITEVITLANEYPVDAKITVLLGDKVIAFERQNRRLLLEESASTEGEYVVNIAYTSEK
jgi:hypothetical protein